MKENPANLIKKKCPFNWLSAKREVIQKNLVSWFLVTGLDWSVPLCVVVVLNATCACLVTELGILWACDVGKPKGFALHKMDMAGRFKILFPCCTCLELLAASLSLDPTLTLCPECVQNHEFLKFGSCLHSNCQTKLTLKKTTMALFEYSPKGS